jgi:branched-chain amino acid transport system permease protein
MTGLSNLLSLGQAAFYGIGAYITALALKTLGLPLVPSILLSVITTIFFAYIIGKITLKLKGDYFILATLGFQIIVYTTLYNWITLTKGPYGISGIPSPKFLGFMNIEGSVAYCVLSSILAGITIFVFYRLTHSSFARALRALRSDRVSMLALGKNIASLRLKSFIVSSSFTAISGFLYASYISYIDPTSFNIDESIFIISAVLIGGTGRIRGPVAGTIFVVILPELLRFVGLPDSVAANLRMIIYGLIMIILMRYRSQGIAGSFKF